LATPEVLARMQITADEGGGLQAAHGVGVRGRPDPAVSELLINAIA